MDYNANNNIEENTVKYFDNSEAGQAFTDTDEKNESGNKLIRGLLTAAVSVLFSVFVYLLIYFCENTGV